MPKKPSKTKLAIVEAREKDPTALPEFIATNPVMVPKKALSKKGMNAYQEQVLLLFAPTILPEFFKTLREKVMAGDADAMKMAGQIFGYMQKGGISITNNIMQSNVNNASASAGSERNFDAIVRMLANKETTPPVIDVAPGA